MKLYVDTSTKQVTVSREAVEKADGQSGRQKVERGILRHSKIALTMEIYTEVRSASSASGWATDIWPRLLHFAAAPRSQKAGPVLGTGR